MGDQPSGDAPRAKRQRNAPERFVPKTELRDQTKQQDSAFKQPQPAGSPEGSDADENSAQRAAVKKMVSDDDNTNNNDA